MLMFRRPKLTPWGALIGAALVICFSLGVWTDIAGHAKTAPSKLKLTHIDAVLTVKMDRTAELVETRRITVLAPGLIKTVAQQVATYIDGMESLDVVEAYTQKADGRRLVVPPQRIFRRNAAIDGDGYTADQKAVTAFFPDVSVGDTVVFTTRMEIRSGTIPGHFVTQFLHSSDVMSNAPSLKVTIAEAPRSIPDPGSTYRIVVPREMAIRVGIAGEGLTQEITEDETTIAYKATFGAAEPSSAVTLSAVERGPRILISTLRSYQELGESYWAAAAPHVKVTPEIQRVADEITAGIEDRREQAKAISRWVKSNIRYLIVHEGIGRDLSTEPAEAILRNRYGECKEHAILTAALLAAKNIESELVLIYLGKVSTLPEPPTLAFFNHLIIYLPEFGLFDDPTAADIPFGTMPKGGHSKPVVLLSEHGARVDTTPAQ
jgi:uncharacterized protein DUF3857/transglutaminase superfamily protein